MFSESETCMWMRIARSLLMWGFVFVAVTAMAAGSAAEVNVETVEIAVADGNIPTEAAGPAAGAAEVKTAGPTAGAAEVRTAGPAAGAAEVRTAGPTAGAAEVRTAGTIQSITFKKDAGIRDALRFLAAKYQKNIVPSSKVDGLITVSSLYDVTFEEAMDAILGHGFRYEQEGNFIKVYAADEYEQIKKDKSRMIYKMFTLYYVAAAEARKLILPVLSENGKVEVTTAAETGVPVEESISSAVKGGDKAAMNDTIIVYDYPENVTRAEEVVASLDVKPKQILIEATILSATLTEDMQFGIDWQTLNGTFTALSGITRTSLDYYTSTNTSVVTKTGGLTVGFPYESIAAFIRAVETVTDVTILANPKILAINKQVGQVYIGTKIGYKSQTTQTDTSTTQQVEFLDTGTKLSFRPYICDDGYIRMDIHSKDSSGSLDSQNIPDETSAELVSNIMVKDGQTIVIGGLFRDKVTATRTQIPVLGDLPVVGWAFRGTTDKSERQEVMVLLTPHIITEPNQLDGEVRAADIGRKRIGMRETLQWANRTKLADDRYANAVEYYTKGKTKKALNELNWALIVRPTHLEALRLKERIIRETAPDSLQTMERVMLEVIEKEESRDWLRR